MGPDRNQRYYLKALDCQLCPILARNKPASKMQARARETRRGRDARGTCLYLALSFISSRAPLTHYICVTTQLPERRKRKKNPHAWHSSSHSIPQVTKPVLKICTRNQAILTKISKYLKALFAKVRLESDPGTGI